MDMAQKLDERGVTQRAQRQGLSLRRPRASARDTNNICYWLVAVDTKDIVAGGDTGLSLHEIATWLGSKKYDRALILSEA
jgi:hypothetical protein